MNTDNASRSNEAQREVRYEHTREFPGILAQLRCFGIGLGQQPPGFCNLSVLAGQPFAKQGQDDLVRDQLARVHRRPGLEAERRLAGDGIAQQVAGGHLRDAVLLDEALCLRAFP